THEDLDGIWTDGHDFGDHDGDPDAAAGPCGPHGTHVAGTVAAATDNGLGVAGVASGVRVLPAKVGTIDPNDATNCLLSGAALIDALHYVAGAHATLPPPSTRPAVVNLSLGSAASSFFVEEAVSLVVESGISVVAATGNDDGPVAFPAAHASTIAVGAVDHNLDRASYSNFGNEVTVVAPGGDQNRHGTLDAGVLSTVPGGYAYFQGTSMAAPHVAGLVGLMHSVNRDLRPADVRTLLTSTATDLGITGRDTWYGYGLIDANAAVVAAQDALQADAADVIVRIKDGTDVVATTTARTDGTYRIESVPMGSFTLEAGTDVDGDGVLGEGGEFHHAEVVNVVYDGDVERHVILEPR
ncbi:MAG: S8 family serine peptidase, partial [Trueperaceae bacterium]